MRLCECCVSIGLGCVRLLKVVYGCVRLGEVSLGCMSLCLFYEVM